MKSIGEVKLSQYEIVFILLYSPSCPTICDPTGEHVELVLAIWSHMAPIAQVLVDDIEPADLNRNVDYPTEQG